MMNFWEHKNILQRYKRNIHAKILLNPPSRSAAGFFILEHLFSSAQSIALNVIASHLAPKLNELENQGIKKSNSQKTDYFGNDVMPSFSQLTSQANTRAKRTNEEPKKEIKLHAFWFG